MTRDVCCVTLSAQPTIKALRLGCLTNGEPNLSAVAIGAPRQYVDRGWAAVAAPIEIEGRRHEVYFRLAQGPVLASAAPFVLTALVPAMRRGLPLRVEAPLSAQFLALLARTQALMHSYDPQLCQVPVEATRVFANDSPPQQQGDRRGVGLFFSGGVDSFYSLLTHRAEISHLIYIRGFDTLLPDHALQARNLQALRQAAAEVNKPLIEVETNLREMLDACTRWTRERAATAQLAIALVLGQQVKTVYLGEDFDYFGEKPVGEIPFVLGADGVETVFDGLACLRVDKTAYITSSQTAMRWLRVCWQNRGDYNCGRCEKCLRTMIALHLAGALPHCRTFGRPIDLERVRHLYLGEHAYFWPELLIELERRSNQPSLAKAVRDCLGWGTGPTSDWLEMLAALERRSDHPALTEAVRELAKRAQVGASPQEQAQRLRKLMQHAADLDRELDIIKTSSSWKLTAPLRAAGRLLRGRRGAGR